MLFPVKTNPVTIGWERGEGMCTTYLLNCCAEEIDAFVGVDLHCSKESEDSGYTHAHKRQNQGRLIPSDLGKMRVKERANKSA